MNSASSLRVKLVLDLVTAKMLFLSWGNVGAFVLHPARQGPTPGFPYRQAKKKFQELSSPYKQAGRSMYDEFYTSSRRKLSGLDDTQAVVKTAFYIFWRDVEAFQSAVLLSSLLQNLLPALLMDLALLCPSSWSCDSAAGVYIASFWIKT